MRSFWIILINAFQKKTPEATGEHRIERQDTNPLDLGHADELSFLDENKKIELFFRSLESSGHNKRFDT